MECLLSFRLQLGQSVEARIYSVYDYENGPSSIAVYGLCGILWIVEDSILTTAWGSVNYQTRLVHYLMRHLLAVLGNLNGENYA